MDAIYARQSVDKKDSISIEGQIDLCRKECTDPDPLVFQDKGYSGKNTDRPDFQRMISAVRRGEIGKIVVYRLDRISRSITDFGRIWETLKDNGAEFVSVNEKFDTSTPVGRAMVYIIMVFAQLERETIAERIKDNYCQRAKRGAYLGGPATFGFKLTRTVIGGKAASMLVPDENVEYAKQLFHRYAYTGASLGRLTVWLEECGVPGTNRKNWDSVALSRILHSPTYVKADADVYYYYQSKGVVFYNDISEYTGEKGLWVFGKRPVKSAKYSNLQDQLVAIAAHDGIIDSETFLACQRKLDSNRQIKNTGAGKYTWLSGLVKCGSCGYSLRVIRSKDLLYFSCSGKTNLHLCDLKHTEKVVDVEAEASRQIQDEIDRLSSEDHPAPQTDNHNAEKIAVTKIDDQIGNLMDRLQEANDITMRYINGRISELDAQRSSLLEIINQAPERAVFKFANCDFVSLNFDEKKSVAQALVKRVDASPSGVTVYFM